MKALSANRLSSRKRKIIIISAIILAVLLSTGAFAYYTIKQQQQTNENTQRDASTVKEEQVKNEKEPQGTNSQNSSQLPSKTGENSEIPPPAKTPSTPPEKPILERASGDPTIKVVATFQKASAGYCELQLSAPGQQTQSYTSGIVVSASYYACSFSIARSSLPNGSWSAVVIHHIGEATTNSDTRSIN
jgi:cytoskeletal protein RodZ